MRGRVRDIATVGRVDSATYLHAALPQANTENSLMRCPKKLYDALSVRTYGFRWERCCADALDQCHKILRNPTGPRWILEGDTKACFDRISHNWLRDHIPMDKELLRKWLKASFLEKHVLFATTEGTPQGGIVSPALANRTYTPRGPK
jgi:retron-type reverse transcriptase